MPIVINSWYIIHVLFVAAYSSIKKKNLLKRKIHIGQMMKKIDVNSINIGKDRMLDQKGEKKVKDKEEYFIPINT